MLKEMIDDPDDLREECNERDGWYSSHAFERIKTVLRHKFFSLLEGHPATDEECRALLSNNEGSAKATITNRSHKLRAGNAFEGNIGSKRKEFAEFAMMD
ncbi:hypothetical protein DXG01_007911 [Tephrocybe rancida]|nr:hypothetical protein DXG01_007911 [Tephrocybe rancida]